MSGIIRLWDLYYYHHRKFENMLYVVWAQWNSKTYTHIYICIGDDGQLITSPHHGDRDTLSSRVAILIVLMVFLISATGMILVFAQFPDLDEYVCHQIFVLLIYNDG